ncbi:LysR family transcriptional regulator [Ruminococcus sp.]|uniref:LysR family transcriptional regulator n=1 Tax=Ruminococcus sp. TaxID=41978 RepID=UPI0026009414|nr:LysR family transcriptional regulator [Ruminococcus sp.]
MTLQQLKYVVATAEKGSISEAAKSLFITQPSLTNAIRELEKEMNVEIFSRTNKGIIVSKEGEIFLGYARQVLEQASLLEERYMGKQTWKRQFCISTQHYSFAVNAFVDLIKEFGGEEYDFSIRETQTHEIIDDVARMKSEIGILYLNDFNEPVLRKLIKSNGLTFTELFSAKPHVFVGSANPLAKRASVTLDDLKPYPYLSFEQGEYNSFYYSEEILSTIKRDKNIRVRDRATLFNLLIGLNGYTICSGVIDEKLNGSDIVAVPLEAEGAMRVGILTNPKVLKNSLTDFYIAALKKYITPNP